MIRAALIALAILAAAPSTAQVVDPLRAERIAVAQDYIALSMEEMTPEAMAEASAGPVIEQLRLTNPSMTDAQEARIRTIFGEELAEISRAAMQEMAAPMADIFTLEELVALRDFYADETGRAVMRKMPDFFAAMQPMVLEGMQAEMVRINNRILGVLSEEQPVEPAESD
ncbi:MAG: DUF2059 domain-containing protein [Rubricella sp.]